MIVLAVTMTLSINLLSICISLIFGILQRKSRSSARSGLSLKSIVSNLVSLFKEGGIFFTEIFHTCYCRNVDRYST